MAVEYDALREFQVDLERGGPEVERLCKAIVRKAGFDTVAVAQQLVPVDTGHLKNSIGVDFDPDGLGFDAGPTANYGAAVEYGTRPHVIKPKKAKALHWVDENGDDVFARRVNHPGTAPRPYMRPAFERAADQAERAIEQVVDRFLA